MRHGIPLLSRLATTLVAIGITVVSVIGHAAPNSENAALRAPADLCADAHKLDMTQTRRVRGSIYSQHLSQKRLCPLSNIFSIRSHRNVVMR
jgi:hypothetical protein